MEFGVCTNFAAPADDPVGIRLIPVIAEAGYDFVELPLCRAAALSDAGFAELKYVLQESGLTSPAACNLFPDEMILRGGGENPNEITEYLDHALSRAAELGISEVVFASVSAWNTDGTPEAARQEIVSLVRNTMLPVFQKYGIRILMEGIRKQVSNVLNTLPQAAAVARQADYPLCGLMADLFHMLSNEESSGNLAEQLPAVRHVHIAELDRKLPVDSLSPPLEELVAVLRAGGYDGRISFEVRGPFRRASLRSARDTLTRALQ